MDGKAVLIIEDEPLLRSVLAKSLEKAGFTVYQVADGAQGKNIALSKQPGIILLDIMLPGEDGLEILRELRTHEAVKNIPIIIISNLADPSQKQKCIETGAVDYLIKADYRLDQMVEKVKDLCGGQTPQRS